MTKNKVCFILFGAILIAIAFFIISVIKKNKSRQIEASKLEILYLIENENYEKAIEHLEYTTREFGDDFEFLLLKGDVATFNLEFEDAEKYYIEALTYEKKQKTRTGSEILILNRKLSAVQEKRPWTTDEIFSKKMNLEKGNIHDKVKPRD